MSPSYALLPMTVTPLSPGSAWGHLIVPLQVPAGSTGSTAYAQWVVWNPPGSPALVSLTRSLGGHDPVGVLSREVAIGTARRHTLQPAVRRIHLRCRPSAARRRILHLQSSRPQPHRLRHLLAVKPNASGLTALSRRDDRVHIGAGRRPGACRVRWRDRVSPIFSGRLLVARPLVEPELGEPSGKLLALGHGSLLEGRRSSARAWETMACAGAQADESIKSGDLPGSCWTRETP